MRMSYSNIYISSTALFVMLRKNKQKDQELTFRVQNALIHQDQARI